MKRVTTTKHNIHKSAKRPKNGRYHALGKQIFKYREDNGLTLAALGKKFNVKHRSTVLRWEQGFVPIRLLPTLRALVGVDRAA